MITKSFPRLDPELDYSVIIPAYNEEKYLPATLNSLALGQKKRADFRGEIIVVNNQSEDNTAKLAKALGCKVVDEQIRQIARVRNTGARVARGRWLIFVDADTIVPETTFSLALDALKDGCVACGGAKLCFDNDYSRWFSGKLIPRFWNFISSQFKLFAGSFIFCRADLFFECGGFPETHFAGEEIVLARNLKRRSKEKNMEVLIIDEPPVISSARKLEWYSDFSILRMMLPLIGIPLFLRNQKACRFWYDRPTKD